MTVYFSSELENCPQLSVVIEYFIENMIPYKRVLTNLAYFI